MYVVTLKLSRNVCIGEAASIVGCLGRLWSVRGNEIVVVSNSSVDLFKTSLTILKASKKGLLVNSLTVISPKNNTIKTIVENMELSGKTQKLIKVEWKGLREICVESETPLVVGKNLNIFNLILNPSNEVLGLNNLILKKIVIRKHFKEHNVFSWKAVYRLRFNEAIYLKTLGVLGIGQRILEGYGKFKLVNV